MEQRRGSTSQPLEGAGFDPAFVPGLTAPVPGEPEDERSAKEAEEPEDVRVSDGTAAPEPAEQAGEPEEEEEAPDPGGPVFEAADRRARIVADHKGVRLALDDQSCEFRWDEVGAVETETGRFGKRFTVTVHTTDRRWYPIEIEATSRSRFPEWEGALDEVLDAYFEDGETRNEAEPEVKADAEAEAKADGEAEVKADAEPEAKADGEPEVTADAEPEVTADAKADANADAKRKANGDE
ncbi:hypothetical protein [Streptomyces sp. b94]|uniref:hypothetical protein n=1 Tax=Streptomyces sp. b94 TaxID=1827634 RepID=UPI0027DE4312|nr:hypothetical protein [Streptomyces sp. b94]